MNVVTLNGEDFHVSWWIIMINTSRRATDYSHAVSRNFYRMPKIIFSGIAGEGLANLHPFSAITVGTIDCFKEK